MTDTERKDLAQAYRTMMEMAAWKHFEEKVLNNLDAIATKNEDEIAIADLNLALIGECRGRRNAIRKIKSELSYILDGLK